MAELTGWQKSAREIGDWDLVDTGSCFNAWREMKRVTDNHYVGDWLPAEAAAKEILRLREELRKAVELLKEAAPRFVSYEECLDEQSLNEASCVGNQEHELRIQMDEFIERNKETR